MPGPPVSACVTRALPSVPTSTPTAAEARVAAHVLEVLLEPARHVERLGDGRVEPGLEHEAVVARDAVVRDLEPGVGVLHVLELGRERRAHVEAEPRPTGRSEAAWLLSSR